MISLAIYSVVEALRLDALRDGNSSGDKRFLLGGIHQRHIWFQDAVHQFAFLFRAESRDDGSSAMDAMTSARR